MNYSIKKAPFLGLSIASNGYTLTSKKQLQGMQKLQYFYAYLLLDKGTVSAQFVKL